jgi:hypothetical protein
MRRSFFPQNHLLNSYKIPERKSKRSFSLNYKKLFYEANTDVYG